ncbi:MAG: hypothetical protein D6693_03205 [Planctomycetota bacterium]|nr:MAG: hypothetical protein D6693_03205 [Planctomycetota bacterium]
MTSEARRQISRVAANYARLAMTFAIGVALTRVQFAWLGPDGFGLIALLASAIGLGSMFDDFGRQSLVRELAQWHATDRERFLDAHRAAYVVSAAMAGLTAATFLIVFLVVPLLRIEPEMAWAARVFIVARGAWQTCMALMRPVCSMYIVRESFAVFNTFTVTLRANELIGAVVLFVVLGTGDAARGVALFGVIPAVLNLAALTALTLLLVRSDRALAPGFRGASRRALRDVAGTFGWNSGVILATSMHDRVSAIIMNIAFGVWGNAVFGLAFRLVAYARMASIGMVFGVDASSARLAETGRADRLRSLLRHATRGQAVVMLPLSLVVIALAPGLLEVWVGAHVDDPEAVLGPASILARILMVGIAARAISDGWLRILYGAGHVRSYAKMILFGGALSPALTIILIVALPDGWAFTAVGWSYAALILAFHCVAAPALGAKRLGVGLGSFYAPLLMPAIAAALPAPILLARPWLDEALGSRALGLAASGLAYAAVYAALVPILVMTGAERRRLIGYARGRMRARRDGYTPP